MKEKNPNFPSVILQRFPQVCVKSYDSIFTEEIYELDKIRKIEYESEQL